MVVAMRVCYFVFALFIRLVYHHLVIVLSVNKIIWANCWAGCVGSREEGSYVAGKEVTEV